MMLDNSTIVSEGNTLRIATCPVNWNNNDLPGWRPITPFPDILDRMREAGYLATEYDASFGSDVEVLRKEIQQRGMTWTGSYQWVDFLASECLDQSIRDLIPTFELLNAIECRNLIVADSLRPHRVALAGRVPADESASLNDHQIATLARGVQRLAEVAASHSIKVRYHNHVGTWIETPHELETLLPHLDTTLVDLCFDTGHFAYGGGNPADFIAEHHDLIGYLHLKDVDYDAVENARTRELTFMEALKEYVFSPIGTGTAEIPAILEVLLTHHYSGWIVVEQDTCEGDNTTTARDNRQFIVDWLNRHGTDSSR